MNKSYLAKFNFMNYKGAEDISINFNAQTPEYYIEEISTLQGNNIYLREDPDDYFNYFIESEGEMIYADKNLSGLCRGLTNLLHTDVINKEKLNYHYVKNLHTAFANCYTMQENPISAKYVNSMYGTYYNCTNIIGSPYINANVNNLIGTFYNCRNITGSPVINKNVRMTIGTYYQCDNLSGRPVPNVYSVSMAEMYYNCDNISGQPSNCNNAFVTAYAYYRCPNIYGTFYWDTAVADQKETVNARYMFAGRNTDRYLNIYVKHNQCILNALINSPAGHGQIYERPLTWTLYIDSNGFPYYINTEYKTNIYCDYKRININSFNFDELAMTGEGFLSHSYNNLDSYYKYNSGSYTYNHQYYNYNYYYDFNFYLDRWKGFINTPPEYYNRAIVLNSSFGIYLYVVRNLQKQINKAGLIINSTYSWSNSYDSNNSCYNNIRTNYIYIVNNYNFYFYDYYMYIKNYNLNELYFVGDNHYNIKVGFLPQTVEDNIISDLSLINTAYQNRYSFIRGVFDNNSILYPIESENTTNMSNSFIYFNPGNIYSSLVGSVNYILYNVSGRYNVGGTGGSIVSGLQLTKLYNNGNNTKIIPICTSLVQNMAYTYVGQHIFGDAICNDNVVNFYHVYENANIDNSIHCGPKVEIMDGAYKDAISTSNKTKCGVNVQSMSNAYENYRARYSSNSNTNREITINIGDKVKYAQSAFKNTIINIENIKFSPNTINAAECYMLSRGVAPAGITATIPPMTTNISWCFSSLNNLYDINNLVITNTITDASFAFRHTNISYPLDLRSYNIEYAENMYEGCYNLLEIGKITQINMLNNTYAYCSNLNWFNFAKDNIIELHTSYLDGTFASACVFNDINSNLNTLHFRISPTSGRIYMNRWGICVQYLNTLIFEINDSNRSSTEINTRSLFYSSRINYLYFNANNTLYFNINSYYYSDDRRWTYGSDFIENSRINHLIATVPTIIYFGPTYWNDSGHCFYNSYVSNMENIWFQDYIIGWEFYNLSGTTRFNFTSTCTMNVPYNRRPDRESLCPYCSDYLDFYFKSPGDTSSYRSLLVNINGINCASQANFIFDYRGCIDQEMRTNIEFIIRDGSFSRAMKQKYFINILKDDSSDLTGCINLFLNLRYAKSYGCNFYYSDSFVNFNYHLWFNTDYGTVKTYSKYLHYIRNTTQDNHLLGITIMNFISRHQVDDSSNSLQAIFNTRLIEPNSLSLPNLQMISLGFPATTVVYENNGNYISREWSNTITLGTSFVTTPTTLNLFTIYTNAFWFNHLPPAAINILTNTSFIAINTFSISGYCQLNRNAFDLLGWLHNCGNGIFNNIHNYTYNIVYNFSSYYNDARMDGILKAVLKKVNQVNSSIVLNSAYKNSYYDNNSFADYPTSNIFSFISAYGISNFNYSANTFFRSYDHGAYPVFNNKPVMNNFHTNYCHNNLSNLLTKWKAVNLYGLFGTDLNNTCIRFTNSVGNVNAISSNNFITMNHPILLLYIYNSDTHVNGRIFGDITWDVKTKDYNSGIYSFNYYNIARNLKILFNAHAY